MIRPDPIARVQAALAKPGSASSDYDLNPDIVLPEGRKLRPAGVLVPILYDNNRARVLLTKRSSALKHHPGQIAFPGGKQDQEDRDINATALREASEEVGLDPVNVQLLGQLPSHETVTGFDVTPVVALVKAPFLSAPEQGEVEEIFEVPLNFLLDLSNYQIQARRWRGRLRHYYTVPLGPYYIWGATARMLRSLAAAGSS